MRNYWAYITGAKYSVGTTGQSVFLFDENGNELKCFKDLKYGYAPIFSPDEKILVVKSTEGRIAVYSTETLSLIQKFRFSKVDGAQSGGYCFSPDGLFFINLEVHEKESVYSTISFYNTEDFSLESQIIVDDNMMVNEIEFDEETNEYFVLGFFCGTYSGFIGKLENKKLVECVAVSLVEYDFYSSLYAIKQFGFTSKALQWFSKDFEFKPENALDYSLSKRYYSRGEACLSQTDLI